MIEIKRERRRRLLRPGQSGRKSRKSSPFSLPLHQQASTPLGLDEAVAPASPLIPATVATLDLEAQKEAWAGALRRRGPPYPALSCTANVPRPIPSCRTPWVSVPLVLLFDLIPLLTPFDAYPCVCVCAGRYPGRWSSMSNRAASSTAAAAGQRQGWHRYRRPHQVTPHHARHLLLPPPPLVRRKGLLLLLLGPGPRAAPDAPALPAAAPCLLPCRDLPGRHWSKTS